MIIGKDACLYLIITQKQFQAVLIDGTQANKIVQLMNSKT